MKERRRAPRIDLDLALKLRLPKQGETDLGQTVNLSYNGVYFRTSYHMEEGTRLPLTIYLDSEGNEKILAEGLVVRCRPELENPDVSDYMVACFFMDMEEKDKEILALFVQSRLTPQTPGQSV